MILLAGGTSEGLRVERLLVDAGIRVLSSQATEVAMAHVASPLLEQRHGRLDSSGFRELFRARGVRAVIDAAHPFAVRLRQELATACRDADLRRLRVERPGSGVGGVRYEPDHLQAARWAFARRRPVFLATGSRSLPVYVGESRRTGVPLCTRLVPSLESHRACLETGLSHAQVIWAQGPFTVADNLEHFLGYGVLVAKDSGEGSGAGERLEAARLLGMATVLVERPAAEPGAVWQDGDILDWVAKLPRSD